MKNEIINESEAIAGKKSFKIFTVRGGAFVVKFACKFYIIFELGCLVYLT